MWTKNPAAEKTATLQYYVQDPEVRRQSWRNRVDGPYWEAEPNEGHRALVELERRAALDTLVTQNIDGLHHAAGTTPDKVVEIHGNVREVKCLSCAWRAPMTVALDRVRAGEEDPDCPECGGILKSATISFGENLVAADLPAPRPRHPGPTSSSRWGRPCPCTRRPGCPSTRWRTGPGSSS